MSQNYALDARVFVRHPFKSWLPGRVSGRNEKGQYTVLDDDREEIQKVAAEDLALCREDLLNEGVNPVVHDLLFLTDLHEATLLRCLKVRYLKNICYTNIGAIVVALNPFNYGIPWYQDTEMDKYLAEGDVIRHNLPHSWAVAHNTYFEMRTDRKDQTILVSGESGAGKTEACKIVQKYLGRVSMKGMSEEKRGAADEMRRRIEEASPILEGFGNAKTVRNNNSSRFGKFIKLKFAPDGCMVGAHTVNYLLEKSRIITAAKNERVYHAFYLLTKGKDAAAYGLKRPNDYRSTFSGKCISREDADDAEDFGEVMKALQIVGFEATVIRQIWEVVAGCLVAQNIELAAIDADTTCVQPSTKEFLEQAAQLWGVSAERLEVELLTTTSVAGGSGGKKSESFTAKLRLPQAIDMRDSLCKHVYEKLFCSLVSKINDSTAVEGDFSGSTIGLLDIFGFEDFEVNSFEQLCINLANEALQNHYNNYIFKKDMQECRDEGINVNDVKCPDNMECLKLITDQNGILGYLDEECKLGTGSDDGFLQNLIQNCSKNSFFSFRPLQQGTFIVRHYAGAVTYTVKGFLEKNRDNLKDEMKLLMRASSKPFIADLLPAPEPQESRSKGGASRTVGGFFKSQVKDLMDVINSTNPHWIRCIKPHPAKKPLLFDGLQVTNQLNSSGVLGTVKIRKAGYPVRMTFAAFFARYRVLIGRCSANDSTMEQHLYVKKAMKAAQISGMELQCGKTRVFMKSEAFFELERSKDEAGMKHRLLLQSYGRALLSQLLVRKQRWQQCVTVIQLEYRDYFRRSEEMRTLRKIAREKLLREQAVERDYFAKQAVECFGLLEEEQARSWKAFQDYTLRVKLWVDDKLISDKQGRQNIANLETVHRNDIASDFKSSTPALTLRFGAIQLEGLPGQENHRRTRLGTDEMREFSILNRLFKEHGATMFRVEVEKAERRLRRCVKQLEDLGWEEMLGRNIGPSEGRFYFFLEYAETLNDIVQTNARALVRVKNHAKAIAIRIANRQSLRERQREIELFSQRHPHDDMKLAAEMVQLRVGIKPMYGASYKREGAKTVAATKSFAKEAWKGALGVPDLDQVLGGFKFETKEAKSATGSPNRSERESVLAAADPYEMLSPRHRLREKTAAISNTAAATRRGGASPHRSGAGVDVSATSAGDAASPSRAKRREETINFANVYEVFRDRMDEMAFIRMRHLLCKEFRELHEMGRYDGPFTDETNIANKRRFFLAQEKLQRIVSELSEQLVASLRSLNSKCIANSTPEQDPVTGMWKRYVPVPKSMIQVFPQCTDWKGLLAEHKRIQYILSNYKDELVKVIKGCVARKARVTSAHELDGAVSVDQALQMYESLKGPFEACSRCLFPMAPRSTLIQLRILWPKVQDAVFRDRCRDCMSGEGGIESILEGPAKRKK
jgi:myosin heavy subunit